MKLVISLAAVVLLASSVAAHDVCPKCRKCHACGKSTHSLSLNAPQALSQFGSRSRSHPPFSNQFRYPRRIDPRLQSIAQREANLLARFSYAVNQRRWAANPNLGHPVGVPPGYIGGTGCSNPPEATTNFITTCEPPHGRFVLVAEAVSFNARDRVWYASRIWRPL